MIAINSQQNLSPHICDIDTSRCDGASLSHNQLVEILVKLSRMGWLIGNLEHPNSGACKGDDLAHRFDAFDPLLGARALETLAGLALLAREPNHLIDAESPMMIAAADVLRTAKGWLALRDENSVFSGDVVLGAMFKRSSLSLGGFAAALKQSASELQGAADREKPPSSAAPSLEVRRAGAR